MPLWVYNKIDVYLCWCFQPMPNRWQRSKLQQQEADVQLNVHMYQYLIQPLAASSSLQIIQEGKICIFNTNATSFLSDVVGQEKN